MNIKESTDLIVLEKLTPAVIFAPGGVDAILENKMVGQEIIKAIVKGAVPHTKIEY